MKKNILLLSAIISCLLQTSAYGMYAAALKALPRVTIAYAAKTASKLAPIGVKREMGTAVPVTVVAPKLPVSQLSQVGKVAPATLEATKHLGNIAKAQNLSQAAPTLAGQLQPSAVPAAALSYEQAIQQAINNAPEQAPIICLTNPIKPGYVDIPAPTDIPATIQTPAVPAQPEAEEMHYLSQFWKMAEKSAAARAEIDKMRELLEQKEHIIDVLYEAPAQPAPASPQVPQQSTPLVSSAYNEFLKSGNIPAAESASMPHATSTPLGAMATNATVAEGAQAAPILASFYSKITGNATAKAAEAQLNAALPMNRLCEIEHKPLTMTERCITFMTDYKYELVAATAITALLVGSYVAYKYYKASKAYLNISPDDVD